VQIGPLSKYTGAVGHPDCRIARTDGIGKFHVDTDDEAEAEAAWEKAERWVRTGEMP
jgi:hypothetical protein